MLPLLLLASLAALTSISIYARDVTNNAKIPLGAILLDDDRKIATFTADPIKGIGKAVCLGTSDLPGHDCFSYHELANDKLQGSFQVIVDESGIQRISFTPAARDLAVDVVEVKRAPGPNLLPVAMDLQVAPKTQSKMVTRKRVVVDDEGVETIVEEEVLEVLEDDKRSWVQKNWMYIVPPLILFLIFAPNEPPKEQ